MMAEAAVKSASGRGRFVTFEGGEGSGKSTQIKILAERLNAAKWRTIVTREPGSIRSDISCPSSVSYTSSASRPLDLPGGIAPVTAPWPHPGVASSSIVT